MRLEQLKQIIEIDNLHSLSQAAKLLYISQPSLSIAVSNLEQELGFKIFKRSNVGVTATTEGEEVLRLARNIISEIEQMKGIKTGNKNIQGNVRFALTPVTANSIAPELILRFHQAYPNVRLLIEECNPSTVIDMIQKGQCNIAFSGCDESQSKAMFHFLTSKGIGYEVTNVSQFLLFISTKNPLAQESSISLKDTPIHKPMLDYSGSGVRFFQAMNIPMPVECLTVYDREILKRFIADDQGVAIFPDFFGLHDIYVTSGLIKGIPVLDLPYKGIHYILYNNTEPLSFLEQKLLETLKKLLIEELPQSENLH